MVLAYNPQPLFMSYRANFNQCLHLVWLVALFLTLLGLICALPFFLSSFHLIVCGGAISLQSCCWLSCCPTCCSAPQGRGSAPPPVHCTGNQNHFSGAWQGREISMVSVIVSINSEVSKVSCCTSVTFLLLKGVSQRGQESFGLRRKEVCVKAQASSYKSTPVYQWFCLYDKLG